MKGYYFVNQAFAQGVGKSVDEIADHRIWDIFPGEEGDKIFSVVKHVFATGKPKTIEVRVPRPEGDQYYIITAKAIKDHHGKAISVICSSKNITDRKRAEEALNRDGNHCSIADCAAPIMDAGQTIVGVVLVFRDITVAQRTEAELLKMEKLIPW